MSKIKEQLISLNLEFEDKEKTNGILQRKLTQQREEFQRCEEPIHDKYQYEIDSEKSRHKDVVDRLTHDSEKLVSEKANLLKTCQDLVEEIKEFELENQAEMRRLQKEADENYEMERKKFKQGAEERLQKVSFKLFVSKHETETYLLSCI